MFKNLPIQDLVYSRTLNEFLNENYSWSGANKTLDMNLSVLETKITNKRGDDDLLENKK